MKRGRCANAVREDELSEHDRVEVAKFRSWLVVETARRAGDDPVTCDMLERIIYPEGVGRPPPDGIPDA